MKRPSVLNKQSIRRNRGKDVLLLKRMLGQLGFGMIKVFLFIFVLVVISLAFIYGYNFLSLSDYLKLETIVIAGVDKDLKQELINLSSISGDESYLSVDTYRLKKDMEEHPWIRSVTVKKKFPDTLYINAKREKASAIVISGEHSYFINSEGFIFKNVEKNDCVDFPAITGLDRNRIEGGRFLKAAASILNIIQIEGRPVSWEELSEVHIDDYGDVTIYFNRLPLKIFLGKESFDRKIRLLKHIIKSLDNNNQLYRVNYIDLGYSDRAVVSFNEKVI